jgi:hypothetical protein
MSYGDWNLVDADGNAMAQRESAMSGNRVVTRSGHEVAQVPFLARCPYPTPETHMTMREYEGVCGEGHRSYLRLDLAGPYVDYLASCSRCGQPARIEPLLPVSNQEQ